jgi:hypothetical protein
MTDTVEVLQKIYSHLRGDLDLRSFRDWMVGAQFEAEKQSVDHARELLWQLEIFYAELSDGLADEALWKKSLAYLADQERPGTASFVVASLYIPPEPGRLSFGTVTSNSIPEIAPEFHILPAV